ncbi:TM2 domain-containing protein [Agromyces endophyticus]|uniref:TM2 domain-containing protein n=1 Tax=Agromyces sp. H17E-10 TaxID=2932244 RepID=UPI001FD1DE41|nr:TM2 domain-containing protein [Agromyces sp. H17E-10]UOQ88040.1 TM2 domain-containing protein [Agromyces sp. H17E-10]
MPTYGAPNADVDYREGPKSFVATWLLAWLVGLWGIDRFYLGKVGTGLAKLFTLGGLGIWWLVDLILVLTGAQRDQQGYRLQGYQQHKKIAWIVTGAVVALGLVINIITGAVGAATRSISPEPQPFVAASPTPAPAPETAVPAEPSPTQAPPAAVDAAAFKTEANSHLDDMEKDLDDMIVTLDEDGFWRLLSNSGELAFNIGQLEALDIPTNVEPAYSDGLTAMTATLDAFADPISNEDDAALRGLIDQMRGQITAQRGIVDTAV